MNEMHLNCAPHSFFSISIMYILNISDIFHCFYDYLFFVINCKHDITVKINLSQILG